MAGDFDLESAIEQGHLGLFWEQFLRHREGRERKLFSYRGASEQKNDKEHQ